MMVYFFIFVCFFILLFFLMMAGVYFFAVKASPLTSLFEKSVEAKSEAEGQAKELEVIFKGRRSVWIRGRGGRWKLRENDERNDKREDKRSDG